MGGYRGDFDPAGFDIDDPTTWPGWTGTSFTYHQGDYWYLTGPGTIGTEPVDVGDRLYPVGFGRLYGDGTYGSDIYGGPIDPPWRFEDGSTIVWRPWAQSDGKPWDRPAPPYAGCPLGDDFDRWRIVLEALYPDPGLNLRQYGDGNYGDDVYGSPTSPTTFSWNDITDRAYGITVQAGNTDGSPFVDVGQMTIEAIDADLALFPISTPAAWSAPRVGTLFRLSLQDPQANSYPLFVGRLEQIEDVHDAPPRLVRLDVLSLAFDLTGTLTRWVRPVETAASRLDAVLAAETWDWAPGHWADLTTDLEGRADASNPIQAITARTEADLTALSAGWQFDLDRTGRPRTRPYPIVGTGTPLHIADCPTGQAFTAERVVFIGDTAETLNVVEIANGDADGQTGFAHREDAASIAAVGERSTGLGFPLSGLTGRQATLDALADRTLDRYSRVLNRAAELDVDTAREPGWVTVVAELDTGRAVTVDRTVFASTPATIDGVVCGYVHRFTPNRIESTLYLSTITRTI